MNFVGPSDASAQTNFSVFLDFRCARATHSRVADATNPCQHDVAHPCGLGGNAFQHLWMNLELIREGKCDFPRIRPSSKVHARPPDRHEYVPHEYLLPNRSLVSCGRCSSGMASFHQHLVLSAQLEIGRRNRSPAGSPTSHAEVDSCAFHASMGPSQHLWT